MRYSSVVAVKTKLELSIPNRIGGAKISYTFETMQGNISFGISYKPTTDGKEVMLRSKSLVSSSVKGVTGKFDSPLTEGLVLFQFVNSGGRLVKLTYTIDITQVNKFVLFKQFFLPDIFVFEIMCRIFPGLLATIHLRLSRLLPQRACKST